MSGRRNVGYYSQPCSILDDSDDSDEGIVCSACHFLNESIAEKCLGCKIPLNDSLMDTSEPLEFSNDTPEISKSMTSNAELDTEKQLNYPTLPLMDNTYLYLSNKSESPESPRSFATDKMDERSKFYENVEAVPSTSESLSAKPDESEAKSMTWTCSACTFENMAARPGCEICSAERPKDFLVSPEKEEEWKKKCEEKEKEFLKVHKDELNESLESYKELTRAAVLQPPHEFPCQRCCTLTSSNNGVILKQCGHKFCRQCLKTAIEQSGSLRTVCPYRDDYKCEQNITHRERVEIMGEQLDSNNCNNSENKKKTRVYWQCFNKDCNSENPVNQHWSYVICRKCHCYNCFKCQAHHTHMNCREYQNSLRYQRGPIPMSPPLNMSQPMRANMNSPQYQHVGYPGPLIARAPATPNASPGLLNRTIDWIFQQFG